MTDLSRPAQPILPKEIISRIFGPFSQNRLSSVPDLVRFGRVHSSWTSPAQQRIFRNIWYKFRSSGSPQLTKLVQNLDCRLMKYVTSFGIENGELAEGCSRLIFLVLESSTNLRSLRLSLPPSFAFSFLKQER